MKNIPKSTQKAILKIFSPQEGPGKPDFSGIDDPRKKRGRRYTFNYLLQYLLCGMILALRTLEALEAFTARRGKRISDSNFFYLLSRLDGEQFRQALHKTVKNLHRSKCLEPVGFPCHVIAIDNKTLYYGEDEVTEGCQETHSTYTKEIRYHLRSVGTMLISNPIMPMLDRRITPPDKNDMSCFEGVFNDLQNAYGRGLLQNPVASLDSGFCSLKNADLINSANWGYILALKNNQPSLFTEAERIFEPALNQEPEYATPWESYRGNLIRFKLYRSDEIAGWETDAGKWEHLRQVWMVVSEIQIQIGVRKKGRKSHRDKPLYAPPKILETRYFLSNILWNYFTPDQILSVVRSHWGIENNGHWTLDVIWNEDDAPWCRKNDALLILAILRAMAITWIRWLKYRHLRNQGIERLGWYELLDLLKEIMALWFGPPRKPYTSIPLRM